VDLGKRKKIHLYWVVLYCLLILRSLRSTVFEILFSKRNPYFKGWRPLLSGRIYFFILTNWVPENVLPTQEIYLIQVRRPIFISWSDFIGWIKKSTALLPNPPCFFFWQYLHHSHASILTWTVDVSKVNQCWYSAFVPTSFCKVRLERKL